MEYNCLNLLCQQHKLYYDITLVAIVILFAKLQAMLFSVILVVSLAPQSIHVLHVFIVLASSPDGILYSVIRDILVFVFDTLFALPHIVYIIFPIHLGQTYQHSSSAE